MKDKDIKRIILFDGECNLCDGFVKFVIERDRKKIFYFASLQSESARKLMEPFNKSPRDFDSIVLIKGSSYCIKSEAALKILRQLRGIWPFFYIFMILPRAWRDHVYDFVAENRYRWFGKSDHCMIPRADVRCRFLDEIKSPDICRQR
jgi:predicted DCC family thiol-disulfide oxidoreductase YuxK